MWVLSVWETKVIPDVSDMGQATIKFFFILGLVHQEFQRESEVPTVGSSDIGREFRRIALNWLRWFTVLVIPDVSGMHDQRPTASFQMPWGSGIPMWVGSSDGRKFRHASGVPTPHKLQLSYLVFKYAEGREFRRESGVPTFIGSFDASHWYCNLVTVGAV